MSSDFQAAIYNGFYSVLIYSQHRGLSCILWDDLLSTSKSMRYSVNYKVNNALFFRVSFRNFFLVFFGTQSSSSGSSPTSMAICMRATYQPLFLYFLGFTPGFSSSTILSRKSSSFSLSISSSDSSSFHIGLLLSNGRLGVHSSSSASLSIRGSGDTGSTAVSEAHDIGSFV